MTERAAMIAAICTDRADDTRRLAYADWLDEHDEHERAEFVRVQVELARWGGCEWKTPRRNRTGYVECDEWNKLLGNGRTMTWCEACARREALHRRERELFSTTPLWCEVGAQSTTWSRGFVSEFVMEWENWHRNADSLFWHTDQLYRRKSRPCPETAQPIERVTLTTPPDATQLRHRLWDMQDGEESFYRVRRKLLNAHPVIDGYETFCRELCEACWPGVAFELTVAQSGPQPATYPEVEQALLRGAPRPRFVPMGYNPDYPV